MLRWGTLLILGTLVSKGYAAEVEFFTALFNETKHV